MKIIYNINARIPAEKAYGYEDCKMCEEFSNIGAEVELWAPTRKNNIQADAFSFYSIKKNFKIRYIKSIDAIQYDKFLGRFAFYFQSLFYFIALFFIRIDKKAIIYTRNPELAWLYKIKGHKTIYECHDWFGKNKNISLFFLKKCDKIIATNKYISNNFIKYDFNEQKIKTATNGIELKIFDLDINKEEAINKLDINNNLKQRIKQNKILLYTGSFKTMGVGKGIEEILKAMRILKDNNFLYFIAVGGIENDINYYRKIAIDLKINNRVEFLGRVGQDQLALFQKASDIMLMPFPDKAHYKYHMAPLKMFEYMAGYRPIIASSLPSIKEILNEKNCLFSEPGDYRDLAECIKKILNNNDLADKISKQAHLDIKNYTWQKRAEKILDFIKK